MGGFESNSSTLSIGSEISYAERLLIAPKIEARVQLYFLVASIAPVYYTDFTDSSLKLRPEVGLGLYNCGVTYGYNAGILNNSFRGVNKHVFSLKYYVRWKGRQLHEYDQSGKKIR